MTNSGKPQELLSATRIAERLQALGEEINQHYQGKEILLISILDGAIVFTADLLRELRVPTQLDCLRISSYGNLHPQGSPLRVHP